MTPLEAEISGFGLFRKATILLGEVKLQNSAEPACQHALFYSFVNLLMDDDPGVMNLMK